MSGPSITGGSSISLNDILVMLYNRSGGTTQHAIGAARYDMAFLSTEVT